MKQKFLLKTMLLLLCMIVGVSNAWGQAEVGTTLWAETWTGGSKDETPSNYGFEGTTVYGDATLTYTQSSNNTKLYTETLAGGTSPELLLSKSNQTWTISNIPTGGATEMSLTFLSNKTSFAVTSSTTGITISGSEKSWTISAPSSAENFNLTIKNTGSANARIDNIELIVKTAGSGGESDLENCDLTLTDSPVELTFDLYNDKSSKVINYTTSSTGTVSIDESDYVTFAIDEENKTITVTPKASVTPSTQTITVNQEADETYKAGSATFTVTITDSTPIPTHTVTFSVNGATTTNDFEEGAAIVFPANPADIYGKKFMGWGTATIDGSTDEKPDFVTSATMGNADVTYYAVFAEVTPGTSNIKTDKLTTSTFGSPSNYGNWSGKSATDGSDAVYAGNSTTNSAGDIQIRTTNNNSGIVTTKSGGKVKKITVVWATSTTNGRTLNIYGVNSPYTGAADLYDKTKQGTLLGSIVYKTNEELTISKDYAYIGLRSNDGAMYLKSISIDWESGTPDTYSDYCTSVVAASVEKPVITVAENPFLFSTTATITCATEGAAIKYSYDGDNWSDYTAALTITETTTIYAKAVKGDDECSVVQVTATKNLAVPTVAIDATGITNTNVFAGTSAGSLSASVTYNDAAVEGAAVTWSGNNDEVATVDPATGVVTLVADGSVTFTATYAGNGDYSEKAATYEMTVANFDPNAPGTKDNPYTVAQAISAIDAGTGIANVYATGKISQIDSYNSTYHSITYWISNDGKTTGDQLEVYSGKGLNNADFSALTDLKVDDEVVIYGTLKKYGEIYEFDKNNYIVSLVRKPTPELTWSAVSYTATYGESNTYPTLTNPNSVAVTYSSSDTNIATIDPSTGEITLKANGETDITATFAGDATYSAQEVSYTLTVAGLKESPDISFSEVEINMAYDDTYEGQELTNPNSLTVTYESSDTDVADVDENTGVLALYKAGTVTITASFAGNETYAAGSASYTLNVTKADAGLAFAETGPFYVNPGADFTVPTLANPHNLAVNWSSTDEDVAVADGSAAVIGSKLGKAIITASFAGDDRYNAGDANYTIIASNDVVVTWDLSKEEYSSATTDKVTWSNTMPEFTMTLEKGKSSTNANNYLGNSENEHTRLYKDQVLTINAASGYAIKSIEITGATSNVTEFTKNKWTNATASTSGKIVSVIPTDGTKNVSVIISGACRATAVTVFLTNSFGVNLNSAGYATFAANAPLDFSDNSDFSAWQITDVSGSTITFSKVTGAVAAGTGVLLMGNASTSISIPVVASGENLSITNKLKGITTATAIEAGSYYGLKGNKFVKVNAGTIPAGKALLPADAIPAGARELNFVFEGEQTTAISEECRVKSEEFATATIYDLQGRKVTMPQKGLYIVNGKKVVVK